MSDHGTAMQGDDQTADVYYRDALAQSIDIGALPLGLSALVGIAGSKVRAGQIGPAAEILGFALNHAASSAELVKYAEPALAALRAVMPEEDLDKAMERGKRMSVEGIVGEIPIDR